MCHRLETATGKAGLLWANLGFQQAEHCPTCLLRDTATTRHFSSPAYLACSWGSCVRATTAKTVLPAHNRAACVSVWLLRWTAWAARQTRACWTCCSPTTGSLRTCTASSLPSSSAAPARRLPIPYVRFNTNTQFIVSVRQREGSLDPHRRPPECVRIESHAECTTFTFTPRVEREREREREREI